MLSPNDPSFFEPVLSPNAPACRSAGLTPVSISNMTAPPPRDQNMAVISDIAFYYTLYLWRSQDLDWQIPLKGYYMSLEKKIDSFQYFNENLFSASFKDERPQGLPL